MLRLDKQKQRWIQKEDGNASIEFVILFPALMTLFLAGFEAGYYMVRNVALERAVDVAMRDVRLGNNSQSGNVPQHAALKKRICDEAGVIPDCMKSLKVEIMPVARQPGGVAAALGGQVRCIDKSAPANVDQTGIYNIGLENQLMLVHVCATTSPLFPSSKLGVGMKIDAEGNTAILAATAFVNEPGQRSVATPATPNGGQNNANGGGNSSNSINSGG